MEDADVLAQGYGYYDVVCESDILRNDDVAARPAKCKLVP